MKSVDVNFILDCGLIFSVFNLAQYNQIAYGFSAYKFLKRNSAYYDISIGTGQAKFWYSKPMTLKKFQDPDIIITTDGSARFSDTIYLHNSIFLGWIPIIPIIILKLLKKILFKIILDDKYLLKDEDINALYRRTNQ